jgi:hypothetical protein
MIVPARKTDRLRLIEMVVSLGPVPPSTLPPSKYWLIVRYVVVIAAEAEDNSQIFGCGQKFALRPLLR